MSKAISRTAARAALLEIQRIADAESTNTEVVSDSVFARHVLSRFIGFLEAMVPSSEWDRTDILRARVQARRLQKEPK